MPLMQNLPKLVDTYNNVCATNNPFLTVPNVAAFGATAVLYHGYMQAFYDVLPVMNDYNKLVLQIQNVFAENTPKYTAMYAAQTAAAALSPTQEINYTDSNARTGHDDLTKTGTETNTRTGSILNGGTDSTTSNSSMTDSTTTYDNATMRDTAQTSQHGGVSVQHGKTTTYNRLADATSFESRKDETAYNSTFTRTITGHKTSPAHIMQQYTDFCKENNVFAEIIRDVVKAISCIVYIPYTPPADPEEEE